MSVTVAGDLLRSADFPNGVATASDVQRLGALLNKRLKFIETLSGNGVNALDNWDGQEISFQVQTPSSVWASPTFQNAWASVGGAYAPAGYYKDASGRVHLRGLAGSGALNTVLFTLPAGFRPANTLVFGVGYWTGTARTTCEIDVGADGTVTGLGMTGTSGYTVWLDGISFLAEDVPGPGILACFPQQLRIEDGRRPIAVLLLSCQDHSQSTTTPAIAATGPQWSFQASSGQGQPNLVSIDAIQGLALGRTYDVSVLVLFE